MNELQVEMMTKGFAAQKQEIVQLQSLVNQLETEVEERDDKYTRTAILLKDAEKDFQAVARQNEHLNISLIEARDAAVNATKCVSKSITELNERLLDTNSRLEIENQNLKNQLNNRTKDLRGANTQLKALCDFKREIEQVVCINL